MTYQAVAVTKLVGLIEPLPKVANRQDHHDHHGNDDNAEDGYGGAEDDCSVITLT